MPNLEDDQFCLEVVARPSRPGCDIKHCEGLYDTKYFKSPSNWGKRTTHLGDQEIASVSRRCTMYSLRRPLLLFETYVNVHS